MRTQREQPYSEIGVVRSDANGHTFLVREGTVTVCLDCGAQS